MENLSCVPIEDWEICLQVLQIVSKDPAIAAADERFKALVAKIHREGKRGVRRDAEQRRQAEDRQTRAETGLVRAHHQEEANDGLKWGVLKTPGSCYICKQAYTRVHPWYHLLCPNCAELNAAKRAQRVNLAGRIALVTGGRVKIGFQLVLRLLRDGASVVTTTRFPADAAQRFASQPDYAEWRKCLRIVGLDLRHLTNVERFAQSLLAEEPALDILVNNAAQTVKRPLAFYRHLLDTEAAASETQALQSSSPLPVLLEAWPNYPAEVLEADRYFPAGFYDADGQQLDTRPTHSWRLRLDEVETLEMLEVHLVNSIAPFLLNSRLKPLLKQSPFARRFIINVSAMEGQFGRENKTVFHPHTNMAKASMNMMTRTSAADYAREHIYMNSVDTGWVTDENPLPQKAHAQEIRSFWTPLDVSDAVARIYDPIVSGINAEVEPLFGHFLKDYKPYDW